VAVASVDVPPLEAVIAARESASSLSVPGDDFGAMVQRRRPREESADGVGGPSSGA